MERLPEAVRVRFEVRAAAIGFSAPPVAVRVRLLQSSRGAWSLYVAPLGPTTPGALLDWLAPVRPLRVALGSKGVLRADFAALPPAWAAALADVEIEIVHLTPEGDAIVSLVGQRAALQRFSARLHALGDGVGIRRVAPAMAAAPLLTPSQDEALRFAVAEGYYGIPRPINLHGLAEKMGITAASLSERLRRAEGRIITRYVQDGHTPPAQETAADEWIDLAGVALPDAMTS